MSIREITWNWKVGTARRSIKRSHRTPLGDRSARAIDRSPQIERSEPVAQSIYGHSWRAGNNGKYRTWSLTHQIDDDGISEKQREAEQHPRQIRSLEGEEAEEIHADVRIASAPDVDKHDGERLAKEHQTHKHCNELLSPVNENAKQWPLHIIGY